MKHVLKRGLSLILVCIMVLALLPTAALAEDAPEAKIVRDGDVQEFETLAAAIAAAQSEEEIILLKSLSLDSPVTIEENKNVALNLDGHTIDVTPSTGNFAVINYGTLELSNGSVKKENGYGVYNAGTADISNVSIQTYDYAVYHVGGTYSLTDCQLTVTAEENISPYGIYAAGGQVSLEKCTVNSAFAGIYTAQNTEADVTIFNSEIFGGVRALIQWGKGTITANSTKFVSNSSMVLEANYGTVELKDGTSLWQGEQLGRMQIVSGVVFIPDATTRYNATWEEYAGSKYGGSNPIQESDYKADTGSKTVCIYTADGLAWWAYQLNHDRTSFAGYTIYVEAETLDMSAYPWAPLNGNSSKLDGVTIQGKQDGTTVIQNLTAQGGTDDKPTTYYGGFIGMINGVQPVTIENLTFDHATVAIGDAAVYGGNIVGVVIGQENNADLTLRNVKVTNSVVTGYGKVGGLVGQSYKKLTIQNCTVDNTVVRGAYNCGGLVGLEMNPDGLTITDSSAAATWDKLSTQKYVCYDDQVEYINDGDVKLEEPMPVSGIFAEFPYTDEYLGYYAAWGSEYTDYTMYYNIDETLTDYKETLLIVGLCHDAEPHDGFTNWTVTKEAEGDEPGEITGYCNINVCDETEVKKFWAVTFDKADGSEAEVKKVIFEDGTTAGPVSSPADPTRFGYTFNGWYTDAECTQEYDFSASVITNMTLYAGWTRIYYPPVTPVTPVTPVQPSKPALNLNDHVAYIIGDDKGLVRPMANITRAEVATIFFRLMTDESRTEYWCTTNSFPDVADTAWYNNAVSTLANAGILLGRPDGTFGPQEYITRAEFAAIAARFSDVKYEGGYTFPDVPETHWAYNDIGLAYQLGWVLGQPDGNFAPNRNITRAEAITLINRVLERDVEEEHLLPDMITWPDNLPSAWYYEAIQEATNSHTYTRTDDQVPSQSFYYEDWYEIIENPDWVALERDWIAASGK